MRKILLVFGLTWGACCFAQDTLFVSCSQTVHLRFSSELKYVNLGSRDLVARIVDGAKDYVAVKARVAFDGCTSLSCLETNGAMHTFVVAYREGAEKLVVDVGGFAGGAGGPDGGFAGGFSGFAGFAGGGIAGGVVDVDEILEMRQGLFHIGAQGYGIEVLCENLLVVDDVLYMLVSVRNRSAVSYAMSEPRFAIESKRRTRRGLHMERALFPRLVRALGTVPPGGYGRMVYAFDKLALVNGQVMRVYLYEEGGSRNFVMEVGRRDLEGVRRL